MARCSTSWAHRGHDNLLVGIVVAGLLAVGCHSPSHQSQPPPPQPVVGDQSAEGFQEGIPNPSGSDDACSLLTQAQVRTAIGGTDATPLPGGHPILVGMQMCRWVSNLNRPDTSVVHLGVWKAHPTAPPDAARNEFERYKQANKAHLEDVADLGTHSVWDHQLRTLLVRDEDKILGLSAFIPYQGVDYQQLAVQLATQAIARL